MGKAHRKKEHQAQKVSHRETPVQSLQRLLAQPWSVLLLLTLLSILIYSNTFSASFHLDDGPNIENNLQIRNPSNLSFSESRYVGYLSFALNYRIGQLNVFGYHLVNLLIHISDGFLVYLLIRLLFKTPRMQSSSLNPNQSFWIAFATSLLFVAHPIQTQAVTYIVQRLISLATLFYLLAVVFYLQWRLAAPESRHRSLYYAGALLSTILAMKTKEIAFTLPFMLFLVEAVFFGSLTRKQWIALVPFLLTLPIIPLSHVGSIGEGEAGFAKGTTEISRLDYLLTQFRVIMTYLRLLILPVHQNLDYDYPISHSLIEPKVLLSFLFLLVLFTFSLYLLFVRPRAAHSSRFTVTASRLVAFGILWFFLTLSIESSIIPIRDVIFEHRLYLPSVGFLLAGSVLISALLDQWRGMSAIAICVLVAASSVATYQRNLLWKDDLTLWADVVRKSPNKARGRYNLGVAYKYLGRPEDAMQEYKAAITLRPNYVEAHNNLGNIYLALGRPIEALQEFNTALIIDPSFAEAHNNLGNLYKNLGRLNEATQEYKTALTLDPNYADAYYNLGLVYFQQERVPEALTAFQEAVKLRPDNTEAHFNLGQAYQRMGQTQEAVHEFEQALQINPNYNPAHRALKSLRP